MTDNHDSQDDEIPAGESPDRTSEVSESDPRPDRAEFDATLDGPEDDDVEDLDDDEVEDLDEDDDQDLAGAGGDPWEENGSVFVLTARQPFEDWARSVLGEAADWTLPPMDRSHAILTPELPTQEDADRWLQQNFAEFVAGRLQFWSEDETAWPDVSLDMFHAWFDVVFAPTVDDARDLELEAHPQRTAVTCGPLSLRQVLAEFMQLPADGSLHVDVETGELFAWTDDELEAIHAGDARGYGVDADDMRELQEAFASESLIEIVHRADIDNVDSMALFAGSIESPTITNRLAAALAGRKARRQFTHALEVARLRNRWSAWFERTAAETLRSYLADRGVPYVDDLDSSEPAARGEEDEPR